AEDGIRDRTVTGVQTCALPISPQEQAEENSRQRQIQAAFAPRCVRVPAAREFAAVPHTSARQVADRISPTSPRGSALTGERDESVPQVRCSAVLGATPPARPAIGTPASHAAAATTSANACLPVACGQ